MTALVNLKTPRGRPALELSGVFKLLRVGFWSCLCLLPAVGYASELEAVADGEDATATDEAPLRSGIRWHVNGSWRLGGDRVTPIDVNAPDPLRLAPADTGEHRLRVGGDFEYARSEGFVRGLAAQVQADFRQSNYTVDTPDGFLLRKAFGEATTAVGRFSGGRTTNHWGLGLVAQDGVDDPMQFGMKHGGGIVDRVQYAILPAAIFAKGDPQDAFPLVLAVAYDWVRRDDLARTDGDIAHHWVMAALYRGKDLQAGFYGVKRDQKDAAGLGLDVYIADFFANYSTWTNTGWRLSLRKTEGSRE